MHRDSLAKEKMSISVLMYYNIIEVGVTPDSEIFPPFDFEDIEIAFPIFISHRDGIFVMKLYNTYGARFKRISFN